MRAGTNQPYMQGCGGGRMLTWHDECRTANAATLPPVNLRGGMLGRFPAEAVRVFLNFPR